MNVGREKEDSFMARFWYEKVPNFFAGVKEFVADFWDEGFLGKAILIFIIAVVLLIPVGIYFAAKEQAAWEAWCKDQGGIVDSTTKTSTGSGLDSNGKPITTTTTETTYYCIVDGKIVDVK